MELFSGIPMPAVSSLPRWRRLRPTRDARGRGRNPFILLGNAPQTTVDAGASIDLAGLSAIISDPLGGGAVIDRGATATLTLGAPNFLGHDLGPLRPVFNGNASLIAVPPSPPWVSPPRRRSGAQLLLTLPGRTWPRRRQEGNSR
jgi:hypothetical protein